MLFEQSKKPFSIETFRNPGACYRGAPFWSWNTWITKEMIEEQILQFIANDLNKLILKL